MTIDGFKYTTVYTQCLHGLTTRHTTHIVIGREARKTLCSADTEFQGYYECRPITGNTDISTIDCAECRILFTEMVENDSISLDPYDVFINTSKSGGDL